MSLPATVPEVIEALGRIVEEAEAGNSRLGLFPALYRKVTMRVQEGIEGGRFQDGPRMARLDTLFANRYLEAYAASHEGRTCSACWRVAFEAAGRWRPTVLQHLLLGIAAHIQFDLGIAAATVAPGSALAGLEADFRAINDVLGDLVGEVEGALDRISPWMKALDVAAGDLDAKLARFGMGEVRDGAWRFAQELAILPQEAWPARLAAADSAVAEAARGIVAPGFPLSALCLAARVGERSSPAEATRLLDE